MSSGKKTTQTGNQSSTQTVTPNNPEWVQGPAQGIAGNIQNLMGRDPTSFFAGASPLTEQSFGVFGNLGSQGANWLGQAADKAQQGGYTPAMAQAAQAQAAQLGPTAQADADRASQHMGAYYNPYEQQVIDNATADMDRARQLTLNSNGQGAIAAGGYGGSRQGVLDANANEQFLRSVGSMAGQLRHGGFNTAAGLGAADADRFTNTSQFNAGQSNNMTSLQAQMEQQANLFNAGNQQQANLANQGAANQGGQFNAGLNMQGAGLLGQLGQYGTGGLFDAAGMQQGLAQQQAGAPLAVNQALASQYGSMPWSMFGGQTQTGNSSGTSTATQKGSFFDQLGQAVQIGSSAASLFSDRRLKQDIRFAEQRRGRNWYDYRYVWDAPDTVRRGVMAQEILKTDPEAVSTHESGYLMVDYSKLEG